MEQQKLPNSTLILILGILSIVGCCFSWGIAGIILAIIVLVLSKKATATYLENPELYTGFQNVKTGKILAYIGLGLGIITLLAVIGMFIFFGSMEAAQQWAEETQRTGTY